jgi:hypothetical protein
MDQPPSSTLSGVAPEALPDRSTQGKVEMVFRFWGANGRGAEAGEGGAAHHPGVLALIEDAVAAKRGVFVSSQEFLYISRLKRPADALVVSRQVQLGLEGFRARHGSGPIAVSIAIDASGGERATSAEAKEPAAAGQEPSHDLVTLLKLSKPAQILLTHDLCQQVAAIKGLPLRSFPARFGVYEYLWTAEERLDLLQSEPQLTLAALPMAGAKEKSGAVPVTAVGAGTTKAFEVPATPRAAAVEPVAAKAGLPRMYVYGGAGLAAVIALAAFGIHMALKPAVSSPPAQAAPVTAPVPAPVSAPATEATRPAAVQIPSQPTAGKAHAPTKPAAAKPVTATAAPAQEAKQPATPSAECTLGADTSRYVGLGEQARGRGDYANAARIFREVLACDPNNTAAREGLEKAMQAQQQPEP